MRKDKKIRPAFLALALLGCLVIVWLCTIVGAASVPASEANRILLNRLFHLPVSLDGIAKGNITIIWNIRFSRILLGFLAGAVLAVSGTGYQSIFKNPMADPFVLGVSSGAGLGAAIGIVGRFTFRIGMLNSTTLLAFAGSFAALFLVYRISQTGMRVPITTLLLAGVAVNSTLSAVMSFLMMMNKQSMDQIMFWTMAALCTGDGYYADRGRYGSAARSQCGAGKTENFICIQPDDGLCDLCDRDHRVCRPCGSTCRPALYRLEASGIAADGTDLWRHVFNYL